MVPFEGNAPKLAGTVITLLVLGCIVLPLRFYVRASNRAVGIDDWLALVAAIPWLGLSIACIGGAFQGIGVHQTLLSAQQKTTALMWFWLFEVFWCIAVIPVKLCIAFLLIRIAGIKRSYTLSLYTVSALTTVMNLIALFYIVFRCTPVSYAWDTSTKGSCQPAYILANIYYAATAINIATDWFCALLPLPLLWNVPMNNKAKISVGLLLSLGVLASLSACVRLRYTVTLTGTNDYLYSLGNLVIWGYAEVGIGFFVGSLSTLRPFFSRLVRLGGKEESQDVYEMSGEKRLQKPTMTSNIKRQSDGSFNESEEDLVHDGIRVSRSVRQSSQHHLAL